MAKSRMVLQIPLCSLKTEVLAMLKEWLELELGSDRQITVELGVLVTSADGISFANACEGTATVQ